MNTDFWWIVAFATGVSTAWTGSTKPVSPWMVRIGIVIMGTVFIVRINQ